MAQIAGWALIGATVGFGLFLMAVGFFHDPMKDWFNIR